MPQPPVYLLDTHCLLWFQNNAPKIPDRVMQEIQNLGNTLLFSQISLFEIAIKKHIGKLPDMVASVKEIYEQAINDGFTFQPVLNTHIYRYQHIPLYQQHRDPFDRLLIATAQEENATILTNDSNFSLYTDFIKVLW